MLNSFLSFSNVLRDLASVDVSLFFAGFSIISRRAGVLYSAEMSTEVELFGGGLPGGLVSLVPPVLVPLVTLVPTVLVLYSPEISTEVALFLGGLSGALVTTLIPGRDLRISGTAGSLVVTIDIDNEESSLNLDCCATFSRLGLFPA